METCQTNEALVLLCRHVQDVCHFQSIHLGPSEAKQHCFTAGHSLADLPPLHPATRATHLDLWGTGPLLRHGLDCLTVLARLQARAGCARFGRPSRLHHHLGTPVAAELAAGVAQQTVRATVVMLAPLASRIIESPQVSAGLRQPPLAARLLGGPRSLQKPGRSGICCI